METRRQSHFAMAFLLISLLVTSCSILPIRTQTEKSGEWLDWDGKEGWSGSAASGGTFFGLGAADAIEEAPLAALGEPATEPDIVESEVRNQSPGLRAGSVDDNVHWDDYLGYRLRFAEWGIRVHDIEVVERHIITVTNPQGKPVLGAEIEILDDQERTVATTLTHSDGTALFFPKAFGSSDSQGFKIRVSKGNDSQEQSIDRDEREHHIVLDAQSSSDPVRLDVHFLIDATGSMSDEIQQLKDNMIVVSERIHGLSSNPDVRFGMTVYRDRGDLFISRTLEFTPDVDRFIEELSAVVADGGGDYAESLNEGLHNAIHMPEWRGGETISLIFLIADAPPHLDYAQDYDYAADALVANERGVKIYPIASSGLDDQGEYIFRQLAQVTSGKFLFLTYGAGGAPGDGTTHHVDDYSVLSLDDLVVRMVEEELAALEGQLQ